MSSDWAMTTMHLAMAYRKRVDGSPAGNTNKCIEVYEQCRLVLTRSSYPNEWAINLAAAYYARIHGSRGDDIDRCIQLYQEYLLVRTRIGYPSKWALATFHLAIAYDARIHGSQHGSTQQGANGTSHFF